MWSILVAALAVVILFFKWKFSYWKRKGVHHPPPVIPFGNVFSILRGKSSLGERFTELYEEHKPQGLRYFGIYFLTRPCLVLADLDLIRAVMMKDFQHFTDHGNYVNEKNDPFTANLLGLRGQKWKTLRAKLTPTFTSGKMKMMFQTLLDCSYRLVEVMDDSVGEREALDIKDILGRYSTDVIGSCAFGLDCNSLKNPNSDFRRYGKKMFEPDMAVLFVRMLSINAPQILDIFKLTFVPKDLTKFFMNIVKETVRYREENNVIRKDFMHLLIQLKNNIDIKDEEHAGHLIATKEQNEPSVNGEPTTLLTIEQLAAQAFVFFIAGFETSSTLLTFCFYELVSNLDIQDKLREEISSVLQRHNGEITYNALMEMTYMDRCLQETLRKYPPIPVLLRECTQTYRIPDSDVTIEKGTEIFIPVLGIHRDAQIYSDPERFDPERFTPENKAKRHPFAWLPFGEGPRACIGVRFGMMQTKVALTILLRNYNFTMNPKTLTPLTLDPGSFTMIIKGGLWLNAEKVSSK